MKIAVILFISLFLIGCATRNKDVVQLPSNIKLPNGYSLIRDDEQKIRVILPEGTTNGLQWITIDVAADYANGYADTNRYAETNTPNAY